ncbi:DUF6440 family protein [Streptococcus sp. E29BA]|uniref:DUF6440 family protein n=1 Tax=Streptococcus sp. E29BA TaxID=3278716 RepID=UPI00359D3C5A
MNEEIKKRSRQMLFGGIDEKESKRVEKEARKKAREALRDRFEATYFTVPGDSLVGTYSVLVDKETGVEYLSNGHGLTPLLNAEGKPKVRP